MKPEPTRAAAPAPAPTPGLRELEIDVAREIAESFLTASSPLEVYRLALARLTPLVGASFASVFLHDDDDPRLFRLACAQNWPQASARFLGSVRIREGRGPTGRAIRRREPVEVIDVFADREMEAWWEPARELGFVSMVSLPLSVEDRVLGALSFYFEAPQELDDDARTLLAVAAHQLAATAERAHLMADLRASNLLLEREHQALQHHMRETEAALERARRDREEKEADQASVRDVTDPIDGPAAGSR